MTGYTASFGAGNNDAWLVKTDSSGNETWNKTFGGSSNDAAESVQQTADSGYIMAGYTGPSECWLIKLKKEVNPPNVNRAPELAAIGDKSTDENSELTFTLSATDEDSDTLSYSATDLPSGATLNSSTGAFSWTPDYSQSGSYSLTFSVDDGNGGTDSEGIIITVNNVNVLEMLDGSEFSIGRTISSEPKELIEKGTAMEGAVTDGCARLLLRMEVNDFSQVILSIEGESNDPENDNGFLQSIDNQDDPQQNQTLIINPLEEDGKKYVFAVYRSPENFVRKDIDKNQDNVDDDTIISERIVTLKVELNSSSPIQKEIKLVRPPVLLIHGLWADSEMWLKENNNFCQQLKDNIPNLFIITADYRKTNSSHFEVNKNVLKSYIDTARGQLRSKGIAMVQADVLGHSMGGILGRIRAGSDYWQDYPSYARKENYFCGDINKLTTLNSPHFGSFLADYAVNGINWVNLTFPLSKIGLFLRIIKFLADKGALEDLMTTSLKLKYMNTVAIMPLSHAIVGDYLIGELTSLPSPIGNFYEILKFFGYDTSPFTIGSDAVVSVESQAGGLILPQSSIFNHWHGGAINQNVLDKTTGLLNQKSDEDLFSRYGFPVNCWPSGDSN